MICPYCLPSRSNSFGLPLKPTPIVRRSIWPTNNFLDFLALTPSPEAIRRFVISPQAQARVEALLDKHGEESLTTEEAAELRVYTQINAVMSIKKAEAALALAQSMPRS